MDIQIDFNIIDERDAIIAQQKANGYRLKAEQYHFDGKHLIFTNDPLEKPPPSPRNLAQELDRLVALLKSKGIL